ncbi:primosomal protein N' [Synechococcus sp. ATX 2A4]|uniref:replication restart helicase PriA n=1 Tax=Synechococcus sp. ATX 2A4 TaxID=2823727 RepID=UPI0037D9E47E|nr:primosomal protein N' [Synechococcus sp. ATX 2A4]
MGFARQTRQVVAADAPGPPSTAVIYWQVWVEAGREGRIFTYANPQHLELAAGDLVRVPLRGRPHVGLVVEALQVLPTDLPVARLLAITALHQRAAVDPHWQELLQEVARQCHTTVFKTLKSALPPGWLGQSRPSQPAGPRPLSWVSAVEGVVVATPRQQQLLEALQQHGGGAWLRDVCGGWGFSRSVVDGLRRGGGVSVTARLPGLEAAGPPRGPAAASATVAASSSDSEPRALNTAQQQALAAILASPPGSELLLWGVTGSGKTEVYLQAAAATLAAGSSVLLLTPEIGLIPQLLDRCRTRFGTGVLEFHSGVSDAGRVLVWRRCLAARRGEPLLVVGTRSAVFLPLQPIGLIVLDEEHDTSYKQDAPMPCYHCRDVARIRCRSGSRLLLGSATPSLETWLACHPLSSLRKSDARRPATTLLRLPDRIGGAQTPRVSVVDMRLELADGHRRLISRALMERLEQVRERGEQAVVLVPRRGYSSFLSCRSCGEVVQCPHCDVALTVHRQREGRAWLRCHWCDHRQEITERCGHCGSTAFKPFGAGTQRVIEQLEGELEGLRVLRFDRDTTRGRDGHRRLLAAFAAGEADVLVGTQMLAKGMDLPQVTLAAVLAADGLLHRPDLRAAEQCLQLLLQLAGRAGRGERPGSVLVQTYSPDHPVICHLIDGHYERFLDEELQLRHQARLVPFSRACLLRFAGGSASATATTAAALAERVRPAVQAAGWELIGPAPAPVARVAGRHRWQLLLHGPAGTPLPLPEEQMLRQGLDGRVTLSIDPDPMEL